MDTKDSFEHMIEQEVEAMPKFDPLVAAIQSRADLNLHSMSEMLQRPSSEVAMKLSGVTPFNVAEVVALSIHLGVDWRKLLSNRSECPVD